MSDPIRSISQNNFILADQKEVSHDNTLSGNGTAESPLGLNETVLFSNSSGTTSASGLSESVYNFQIVEIYTATRTSTNTTGPSVYRFSMNNNPSLFSVVAGTVYNSNPQTVSVKFSVSSTSISTQTSNSGISALMYKVVGINRIANN